MFAVLMILQQKGRTLAREALQLLCHGFYQSNNTAKRCDELLFVSGQRDTMKREKQC